MLIGGVFKVVMNYNLIPVLGIDGAPIATNICYGIIAVLNIIAIIKIVKIRFSILDFILKPLCASSVMAAVALLCSNTLPASKISTLLAIAVGAVIYVIMIFIVGAIKKEDLYNLPFGNKIVNILSKLGIIK